MKGRMEDERRDDKGMEAGKRKEWKKRNGRWKEDRWTDISWKNNF